MTVTNIQIACECKTINGRILGEDMKISRFEALKSMTINGSKLHGTESKDGSIEIGKEGRLIILDENIIDQNSKFEDTVLLI